MTERNAREGKSVQSLWWMKEFEAPSANLTQLFLRGSNLIPPQKAAHVLSRFMSSRVHFIRKVPLIMFSLFHFPCLCVPDTKPPREIQGKTCCKEKKWIASPEIATVKEVWTEDLSACVSVSRKCVQLKGNHVSDTHLGLFPPLDQLRHAGQNPR